MNCNRCKSTRVAGVNAKCSDMCGVNLGDALHDGYVPDDLGIGGGDYVEFDYCLDCGQLQGNFPLPPAKIEKDITDEEVVEFFDNHFVEGALLNSVTHHDIRRITIQAEQVSSSFRFFVLNYLEQNIGMQPGHKHPAVNKFIQMFRERNFYL